MKSDFVARGSAPPAQKEMAADAAGIAEAARVLRGGGLVAFPTETVYGLAADATSDAAVARIYAAKARPTFNPLIAHVTSLDAALGQGIFPADALRLAEAFWPGPLTLVVPLAPGATVCAAARAGQPNIALRVPAHPVALAVISAAGRPLAAPSANRSGRVSPVTAAHVARDFSAGEIDLILDGGRCPVGLEFDDRRMPRRAPAIVAARRDRAGGHRSRAWPPAWRARAGGPSSFAGHVAVPLRAARKASS